MSTAHLIAQEPAAEALAVQADGRIAAVGCNNDILSLQQSTTQLKDLHGAFVIPVSLHLPTLPFDLAACPLPT